MIILQLVLYLSFQRWRVLESLNDFLKVANMLNLCPSPSFFLVIVVYFLLELVVLWSPLLGPESRLQFPYPYLNRWFSFSCSDLKVPLKYGPIFIITFCLDLDRLGTFPLLPGLHWALWDQRIHPAFRQPSLPSSRGG